MFSEDLTAFIDTDEHAVSVQYTVPGRAHPGPSTSTVTGIFDSDTVEVGGPGIVDVRGFRSLLWGAASDYPSAAEGAHVTIDGVIYIVAADPEYDETNNLIIMQLRRIH